MSKKVLITGGTGLIGKAITKVLLNKGYSVSYLSRTKKKTDQIQYYQWDISKQEIDTSCLEGTDYIIHLAGAGVADKPWTESRKKEILESRTKSTQLLFKTLQSTSHQVEALVSASAIGIYGYDTGDKLITESSVHGTDFLAEVTEKWEEEVRKIRTLNIRTVKLRIGIVLAKDGGALPKLAQPMQWGAGTALGNGQQYMSWIHYKDLVNLFIYALENKKMERVYNAVAPDPMRNIDFTKTLAKVLKKPLILPNAPSFALKLALGEMANIVLGGCKISCEKIQESGFVFEFSDLESALKDIYPNN